MREFDLSDAVASFSQHTSSIGTLWGIYVAATFAAAGFGISLGDSFTPLIAVFLGIGFLSFAWGHWHLLRQHLAIQDALREDILADLARSDPDSGPFTRSIRSICDNRSNLLWSTAAHVAIDLCVILIIVIMTLRVTL
jgi:hypothetical protein